MLTFPQFLQLNQEGQGVIMGNSVRIILVSLIVLVANTGFAQEKPSNPAPSISDSKEAQEVRDAVKLLGAAFDVKDPNKETEKKNSPAEKSVREEKKTLADVADKTVDLVGKAVASISASMEKIAPEVWRIMIVQQYTKAVGNLVVPWLLLFFLFLVQKLMLHYGWVKPEESRESDDEKALRITFVYAIPLLLTCVLFVWGVARLSDSIMHFINPEYYAVQDLLRMLLNNGNVIS